MWMSDFVRVPTGQFESAKMKLHKFVRVPRVSDWDKFAVQISKDEAPTLTLLTVGLLCIFCASIVRPSRNFENSQHLSNSAELKTSLEVVHNSGNELQVSWETDSYLHNLGCQYGASANQLLLGSLGSCSKKKCMQWWVVWGKVNEDNNWR